MNQAISNYALSDTLHERPNYGRVKRTRTEYWLGVRVSHRLRRFWTLSAKGTPVSSDQRVQMNQAYAICPVACFMRYSNSHNANWVLHIRIWLPKRRDLNLENDWWNWILLLNLRQMKDGDTESEQYSQFSSTGPPRLPILSIADYIFLCSIFWTTCILCPHLSCVRANVGRHLPKPRLG